MPKTLIIALTFIMTLFNAPSMLGKAHTIIVVRHGEADHNVSGRYNANPEHPAYIPSYLTDNGKKQVKNSAQAISHLLSQDTRIAVFASPLPRTLQTAEILAVELGLTQQTVITDNRLIETNVGHREGQEHALFNDKDPWFPDDPANYDGETTGQITERLESFYSEALSESDADALIFVTHGSPAFLFAHVIQPNVEHVRLETAGFSVFVIKDD